MPFFKKSCLLESGVYIEIYWFVKWLKTSIMTLLFLPSNFYFIVNCKSVWLHTGSRITFHSLVTLTSCGHVIILFIILLQLLYSKSIHVPFFELPCLSLCSPGFPSRFAHMCPVHCVLRLCTVCFLKLPCTSWGRTCAGYLFTHFFVKLILKRYP